MSVVQLSLHSVSFPTPPPPPPSPIPISPIPHPPSQRQGQGLCYGEVFVLQVQYPAREKGVGGGGGMSNITASEILSAAAVIDSRTVLPHPQSVPSPSPFSHCKLAIPQVQHPGLLDTYAADVATVAVLVKCVKILYPSFDYSWLVKEIRATLPKVTCQTSLSPVYHIPVYLGHVLP